MDRDRSVKGNVRLFVIGSYVCFIVLLLVTAALMFGLKNDMITTVAKTICSWSPTIVLLLFFSKLRPEDSRREFIAELFKKPVLIGHLCFVVVMQIVIFVCSVGCYSWIGNVGAGDLVHLSVRAVAVAFLSSITAGATGEEAGWRGYLQPLMAEKYGVIKGSLVVGVIWGFWHGPLWLVSGEYVGIDLVKYICLFLIFIISTAVIIGILYEKSRNIIVPMTIHFFVNFTLAFVQRDLLEILVFVALFYLLLAICIVIGYKRT